MPSLVLSCLSLTKFLLSGTEYFRVVLDFVLSLFDILLLILDSLVLPPLGGIFALILHLGRRVIAEAEQRDADQTD